MRDVLRAATSIRTLRSASSRAASSALSLLSLAILRLLLTSTVSSAKAQVAFSSLSPHDVASAQVQSSPTSASSHLILHKSHFEHCTHRIVSATWAGCCVALGRTAGTIKPSDARYLRLRWTRRSRCRSYSLIPSSAGAGAVGADGVKLTIGNGDEEEEEAEEELLLLVGAGVHKLAASSRNDVRRRLTGREEVPELMCRGALACTCFQQRAFRVWKRSVVAAKAWGVFRGEDSFEFIATLRTAYSRASPPRKPSTHLLPPHPLFSAPAPYLLPLPPLPAALTRRPG